MTTTRNFLKGILFSGLAMTLFSFDLPAGWFKAGSEPKSYEMGIESGAGQDGNVALMVDVGEALGESCGQTGQAGHEAEIARLVRKSGKEGTLQVGVLR